MKPRKYDEHLDLIIRLEYKSLSYQYTKCPTRDIGTESRNYQKVVTRHIWAEDIRHSPMGKESYKLCSQTIERVFADTKKKYGMRYIPYRGLKYVSMWGYGLNLCHES